MSEHEIQAAYFTWARLHAVARRAYAVPNGGHRNIVTASKLKAEGVRAGVLDVCLPVPSGLAHGMYIEFKAGKNTLSPAQQAEAEALAEDGHVVLLCWGAIVAIELTQQYLDGKLLPGIIDMRPVNPRSRQAKA